MADPDPKVVQRLLEKLLASDKLEKSETSRRLLTYLVERAVRNDPPKETELAIDVFGKDASFNGAEDSVVRVGVRTLRQKLAEYYAGAGGADELHFVIPKGAYRLTFEPHVEAVVPPQPPPSRALPQPHRWARLKPWITGATLLLLAASLLANAYFWTHSVRSDSTEARVRNSPVWSDIASSSRPLTIVLGDLFMFTQLDPKTGRTQTVRDTQINSSDELRAFLASNPAFAAERGQRYGSLIQKSAVIGMASILRIVDRPGRRVSIKVGDELQVEDIRNNDIIYVGPLVRLGHLGGHYQMRSRYRYDAKQTGVVDIVTRKVYLPEGTLGAEHTDYALAAKFIGPTRNHIMILTSGARNAGLLQIVRTFTLPEGLGPFEAQLRDKFKASPSAFEALLSVTGFKQTDLAAEIVDANPMPASQLSRHEATTTSASADR